MAVNLDLFISGNDIYIDPAYGDFDISLSDEQHVQDTIIAFPGWWKENPADGVGVFSYQKSSGQLQSLARIITTQLKSDGYQCNNPIITQSPDGTLTINPNVI